MIAGRVHHVSFAVSDLKRSDAFYEGLLGLRRIERPDLGLPGSWYRAGEAEIHLIETPGGDDRTQATRSLTPLANHTAFQIDDYVATLELLRERGVEVLETKPGIGQMWLRDPDGNVIELIRPRS